MSKLSPISSPKNRNRWQSYLDAFRDLKIGQKIVSGNIVSIVLLIVTITIVLFNLNALTNDFQFLVEHDQPVLLNAALLEKAVVDMETGQRGFVITGKDEFLEPFDAGLRDFERLMEEEKVLVSDNPPQVERLEEVERLHQQWLTLAAEPEIEKRREVAKATITSDTLQEILNAEVGKNILDELRSTLDEMEADLRASNNLPAVILTVEIGKDMVDQETGQRGFIITGQENFLEPYDAGKAALDVHIAELRSLLADDPANTQRLDQVESLANDWTEQAGEPEIQARRDVDANPATIADVSALLEAGTGKNILDQIRNTLNEFIAIEIELNQQRSAAVARQNQITVFTAIALAIFGVIGTVIVGRFIAGNIVGPVRRLGDVANQVSAGNLDVQALIESRDEIGELAIDFNTMTDQLNQTLDELDTRSVQLALAAQVGQTISQESDFDTMLSQAANLILKQFDLYYVQIYLTDDNNTKLTIESGTGDVGKALLARKHSLLVSAASINGRAALEKKAVVIPDTAQSTTFRKNPLLPETRGEMAVPLIVANRVVGVLDMQSKVPNALTEAALPAFEALAGQLAVAIQNTNLLKEAEQARAEVENEIRRQTRKSWNEHMDGIHKSEKIAYSFDREKVIAIDDDAELAPEEDGSRLEASISWVGEELGKLSVDMDSDQQTDQNKELVSIVARQVAQQLENIRLLENAERYLNEAEEATRRQTREGWEEYISARSGENMGYAYDSTKVTPYNSTLENTQYAFSLPVKAGNAEIGKLAVDSIDTDDKESLQFANAIAERLGAHIENLRLAEQTRQSLNETAEQTERLGHLNEYSEALSQAETLDDIYNTTARILPTIIDAKRFSMTHPTEDGEMLEVFALQGESGAIPTGTKLPIAGTATGTCFTERRGVIDPDLSENTYKESGLLAKQGLKSTLSVPLVVAGKAIGTLNFADTIVQAYTIRDQDLAVQAASLMASTIENRQQYQRAQKQADRETMLNTISQKIQAATSVEAVLQIAARELGHALGAPMTVAQLNIKDQE